MYKKIIIILLLVLLGCTAFAFAKECSDCPRGAGCSIYFGGCNECSCSAWCENDRWYADYSNCMCNAVYCSPAPIEIPNPYENKDKK